MMKKIVPEITIPMGVRVVVEANLRLRLGAEIMDCHLAKD